MRVAAAAFSLSLSLWLWLWRTVFVLLLVPDTVLGSLAFLWKRRSAPCPPTPLEKKRKKRVGQFGPPTRPINPALQSLKIPSNLALGKGEGGGYITN